LSNNNSNNNNNDNINFTEEEEVEIVNIGREGISYSELKILHRLSMQILNNLSKILTTMTSSSLASSSSASSSSASSSSASLTSTTTPTFFLSKDVKISIANKNFLIPFNCFKESCRVCNYYGHSFKNCSNIKEEFRGGDFCLNCWGRGHLSANCEEDSRVVPYNKGYLTLEEVLNYLMYK